MAGIILRPPAQRAVGDVPARRRRITPLRATGPGSDMSDIDWDAKLISAAYAGDIPALLEAIAHGASYSGAEESVMHRALQRWNVPLLRFLLTSSELPSRPSIHTGHDATFRQACEAGDVEFARWLAAAPELAEHADVHACCDEAFELACRGGHDAVVRWLAAEHGMLASEHVRYLIANDGEIRSYLEGLGITAGRG